MDPKSPEQIEPTPEVVKLNQEFQLFDPSKTAVRQMKPEEYPSISNFSSPKILNTNNVLPNFELDAQAYFAMNFYLRPRIIAPFEPEIGYQIDQRDFNSQTRKEKVMDDDSAERKSDTSRLYFRIKSWLLGSGITELTLMQDIKPQYLAILQTIRAQLQFPNGITLESKPSFGDHMTKSISFDSFYPIDFGPMAKVPSKYLEEGLEILLPSDLKQLSQITARYTISRDEKK